MKALNAISCSFGDHTIRPEYGYARGGQDTFFTASNMLNMYASTQDGFRLDNNKNGIWQKMPEDLVRATNDSDNLHELLAVESVYLEQRIEIRQEPAKASRWPRRGLRVSTPTVAMKEYVLADTASLKYGGDLEPLCSVTYQAGSLEFKTPSVSGNSERVNRNKDFKDQWGRPGNKLVVRSFLPMSASLELVDSVEKSPKKARDFAAQIVGQFLKGSYQDSVPRPPFELWKKRAQQVGRHPILAVYVNTPSVQRQAILPFN